MLVLPATLTEQQAQACLASLLPAARATGGATVAIHAAALQQFDSSALAVLLECRREAARAGKTLRVDAMPPRLQTLAGLYGVADLLSETAP